MEVEAAQHPCHHSHSEPCPSLERGQGTRGQVSFPRFFKVFGINREPAGAPSVLEVA